MANGLKNGLLTSAPTRVAAAQVYITHIQLRNLLICPRQAGLVNYISERQIIEHDLYSSKPPRTLVDLEWDPTCLASIVLPDSDLVLLAAGGQDAELHLSAHVPGDDAPKWALPPAHRVGGDINNAIEIVPPPPGSVEPTLFTSNNDCTVSMFDIAVRRDTDDEASRLCPHEVIEFPVPINHTSVSPDGRMLLSVGDSAAVYLYPLSDSQHKTELSMPRSPGSYMPASFATAFRPDGMMFAVGGQDGMLAVWDVRSSVPLKVFDPARRSPLADLLLESGRASGAASGWLHDVLANSQHGTAPPWGIRSIKFSEDILLVAEHADHIRAIDARTFEAHDVYTVPSLLAPVGPRNLTGCCFSPDGKRAYGASEQCVAEWGVQGEGSCIMQM